LTKSTISCLRRLVRLPTLRSALQSFEDLHIKVLADVLADGTEGELEAEVKEGPDEPAPAADSISESLDPVRLYLREMSNFQLLSWEQEVEIAKRIEAGENEVEEEVLRCPVTLDFVIERALGLRLARATYATSLRRTKSLRTTMRSVDPRPTKSNSKSGESTGLLRPLNSRRWDQKRSLRHVFASPPQC
jgi:hypothetical protein